MKIARLCLVLGFLLHPGPSSRAQATAAPSSPAQKQALPRYEVVSIHEVQRPLRAAGILSATDTGTHYVWDLKSLAGFAFGGRPEVAQGGPQWIGSTPFDINARIGDENGASLKDLSGAERAMLLQPVLVDRFGLKFHRESRQLPVYELVIAKGGPRLQAAQDPNTPGASQADGKPVRAGMISRTANEVRGSAVRLNSLIGTISSDVGRDVVDKTGLTGKYDLTLKWKPPDRSGVPTATAAGPGIPLPGRDNNDDSIFSALRDQLGLELRPAKVATEILVIDDAHLPTEN